MTDDKGPDNEREGENSWMRCTDRLRERKRQMVCDFDRPRPGGDTDSKNTYNESLIISVRGHYGRENIIGLITVKMEHEADAELKEMRVQSVTKKMQHWRELKRRA